MTSQLIVGHAVYNSSFNLFRPLQRAARDRGHLPASENLLGADIFHQGSGSYAIVSSFTVIQGGCIYAAQYTGHGWLMSARRRATVPRNRGEVRWVSVPVLLSTQEWELDTLGPTQRRPDGGDDRRDGDDGDSALHAEPFLGLLRQRTWYFFFKWDCELRLGGRIDALCGMESIPDRTEVGVSQQSGDPRIAPCCRPWRQANLFFGYTGDDCSALDARRLKPEASRGSWGLYCVERGKDEDPTNGKGQS